MADDKSKVFTKKAVERLRGPDELDEYVRVTNPSVWVVLAACVVLLIGLFAWGIFGTAETNVVATAANVKKDVVAFLSAEEAAKVHVGDPANVAGELMEVASVDTVPLSRVEAHEVVGSDYLVSTLVKDDWTYLVRFSGGAGGLAEGVPLLTSITVESIAPMDLIFKGAA